MGLLIQIDNGGTLTDVCVLDGEGVVMAKTLTTPFDLTRCFLDGLSKASERLYGEKDLGRLVRETDSIRYSTTQGTNALVQRRGPALGLVHRHSRDVEAFRRHDPSGELFDALVGERAVGVDTYLEGEAFELAVVGALNRLTSAAATRVVVAFDGKGGADDEVRFRRAALRRFPRHLLGAVPVLLSSGIADDPDDVRRAWTALFNAFLHPPMETFLYHTERELRAADAARPLLVFRNDGASARVAKTTAIKTYSSGPRGGAEGALAYAGAKGIESLVTMDVGGTTTDLAFLRGGKLSRHRHGTLEGVETSIELADIPSMGVGGGSVFRVVDGELRVGPDSVGAAPGPACFGRGGKEATITDALLVLGVLEPSSYFGGELALDAARARNAIDERVGKPLGLGTEEAAAAMRDLFVRRIADAIDSLGNVGAGETDGVVLMAFGGGGPMSACRIAEAAGISRVVVPRLAAVFSASGISFSELGHDYHRRLAEVSDETLRAAVAEMRERAERDMFGEGVALADCRVELELAPDGADPIVLGDPPAAPPPASGPGEVSMRVRKSIAEPPGAPGEPPGGSPAGPAGKRTIAGAGEAVPVFRVEEASPGASGAGPAIIEEAYFTCEVPAGWAFRFDRNLDVVLERSRA